MNADQEIAKLLTEFGRLLQQQRPPQEFGNLTVLNVQLLTYVFFSQTPPKMRAIADAVGLSLPSTSAIVDKLEDIGLVSRGNDIEDKRVVLVHVTKKGRDILQAHIDQTATGIKAGLAGFKDTDKQLVLSFFQKYIAAMNQQHAN